MADDKSTAKSDSDLAAVENTAAAIQKATDEAEAQGYHGVTTDPTPRENYTVAGVTSGKPTPETDEKAAAKAAEAQR